MKIFFSKRAETDFITIKKYIEIKWGVRVSEAFETKTFDFLDLLEDFPELGSLEVKEKNIRGFQLTKQTRVFYKLELKRITILALFDVRQDEIKKPK